MSIIWTFGELVFIIIKKSEREFDMLTFDNNSLFVEHQIWHFHKSHELSIYKLKDLCFIRADEMSVGKMPVD
jgi:hypothetical protein